MIATDKSAWGLGCRACRSTEGYRRNLRLPGPIVHLENWKIRYMKGALFRAPWTSGTYG